MPGLNKKTIVVVIPRLGAGGAEKVTSLLVKYWARRGISVYLFSMDGARNDAFFPIDKNIIWVNLYREKTYQAHGSIRRFVRKVAEARAKIKSVHPDVVLALLPSANVLAVLATLRIGTKTAISERNCLVRRELPLRWQFLRRCFYRFADVIIINRSSNRTHLQQFVQNEKIVFLPNPIELPSSMGKQVREKIILSVGRLVDQKRFDLLVSGFCESGLASQGWNLIIVGDGPLRMSLEAQVAGSEVPRQISIEATTIDIANRYRGASIFALFSEYEGMPNVVLEAMSHGLLPVVSQAIGDLASTIECVFPEQVVDSVTPKTIANCLLESVKLRERDMFLPSKIAALVSDFELEKIGSKWSRVLQLE